MKRSTVRTIKTIAFAIIIALGLTLGGLGILASTATPSTGTSFESSQLETIKHWKMYISGITVNAELYDSEAADGTNTLLAVVGQNTYRDQNQIKSGKTKMSLNVKGLSDGFYTIRLYEAKKGDTSGKVISFADYRIKITGGVPVFYFPGGISEKTFYDGLISNKPSDYDDLPYYAGEMEHLEEIVNLARTLTADKNTTEKKAKAIHDWIAKNISYDYESYNKNDIKAAADPDQVYVRRTGVCSGYARLARIMFGAVGIPCLNIQGYASSAGIEAGNTYNDSNHEWNAVYIDGKWQLMDITWDSINEYYGPNNNNNTSGQLPEYSYYGVSPDLISVNHCSTDMYGFSDLNTIFVGSASPTKFKIGDNFSFNGWIGFTTVTDSTRYAINQKYLKFSNYDMTRAGDQVVTVSYGPWKTTYMIKVSDGSESSNKKSNPIKLKKSKWTYKRSSLKKKKTITIKVTKAKGKVTYSLNPAAKKAKIKVSKKGKVTIPKKCKKGKYKIMVKATGNSIYASKSIAATIVVK